jgi:hypothetical protein
MADKDNELWDGIPSLDLKMDDEYADRVKAKECRRHHRSDMSALSTVLHGDVLSLPIRIATAADGVFEGLILDLSESGCRVALPKKLKEGEPAKVGFIINERNVITKAIVRWVTVEEFGCTAGLEFQGIAGDFKDFLSTISSASLFSNVGQVK